MRLVISGFPSHLTPFKCQDLEKIKWDKGEGNTEESYIEAEFSEIQFDFCILEIMC